LLLPASFARPVSHGFQGRLQVFFRLNPNLPYIRVSICIPTYNRAELLPQALASALAQTGDDVEVVLIDDASTDETLQIASGFTDRRLRVESNEKRLGPRHAMNRCLDLATGVYLKILCDDDLLYPEAVSRLSAALDRFPNATFATSAWNWIDEAGNVLQTDRLIESAPAEGALSDLRYVAKNSSLRRNRIGNPSAVLIRTAALAGLRFDPRLGQLKDWDLWLRLLRRGPLVYLPQVLSANRSHARALSVIQRPLAQTSADLLLLSREFTQSRSEFDEAISLWDVKRLQIRCCADAAFTGMGNLFRGAWPLAAGNASLAFDAAATFLTHW